MEGDNQGHRQGERERQTGRIHIEGQARRHIDESTGKQMNLKSGSLDIIFRFASVSCTQPLFFILIYF
jgi:hypothetical protein